MKNLITALKILTLFTVLTGLIYPLFITAVAQWIFPGKANGSLVSSHGKVIGSRLIGQAFNDSIYFHSRPSATNYGTLPSGASNLSPTSVQLAKLREERKQAFISLNHLKEETSLPSEMLFASASGLDPHISKESAFLQAGRITKARSFDPQKTEQLLKLIDSLVEGPQFILSDSERINVLILNLELDKL
ncbi:MAG: potassium-transporting ATPase subunit KdpC [Bacteroidales bacterium]|nr:potassium-transporting ATPase subunit KdpC [Bacteroidales bacterium]